MLLDQILFHVPCPIFWKDINGIFLGCNKLFLEILGFNNYSEIIGKTDNQLPWKEYKNSYFEDDCHIIKTGKTITKVEDIPLKHKTIISKTTKTPLTQNNKIIGVLGICLDITAEIAANKKAQQLQIQNEQYLLNELKLQKAIMSEQERFKKIVFQVNHDILSPLSSLKMLTELCANKLSFKERTNFKNSIARINDIANNMLNYFNPDKSYKLKTSLIYIELIEILNEKILEYNDKSITFNHNLVPNFASIVIDSISFKRMISNIINNAVNATKHMTDARINIKLKVLKNNVVLTVEDNGIGMPEIVRQSILNNITITHGGHGIGFMQIRDTLAQGNGSLNIITKDKIGTQIILNLPKVSVTKNIVQKIVVAKNKTIVVLDEDLAVWKNKLINVTNKINYFTKLQDALYFINQSLQKVLLLANYNLIDQDILLGKHVSCITIANSSNQINNTKIILKQLIFKVAIYNRS